MGISPYRYKVLAFTIASLFGGVSGFLYMVVIQYTSPETLSFGHSIKLVASMVIGGAGSIIGSLLGGATTCSSRSSRTRSTRPHRVLQGTILLVVLFVLPGGLVSLPRLWRRRSAAHSNGRTEGPRPAAAARPSSQTDRGDARPSAAPPRPTYPTTNTVTEKGKTNEHTSARRCGSARSSRASASSPCSPPAAPAAETTAAAGRPTRPAAASPGITDDSITLGITTPLSGPTAGPGTCTVAGITAYFGAKNAEGGVEFGDGNTRMVEIEALDDTYDPQKAAANFQQWLGQRLRDGLGLGTPTNRAWREAAIDEEVPQVLIQTGDPIFSDSEESPWQLGFVPIYQNEGAAFGELLASSGEDHTVAILSQNDDYGAGYVEGFQSAVEGADNIEIVKELTYEATDTSVDAQLTELAATGADGSSTRCRSRRS